MKAIAIIYNNDNYDQVSSLASIIYNIPAENMMSVSNGNDIANTPTLIPSRCLMVELSQI